MSTFLKYSPQEIEKKWQKKWADDHLYEVKDDDARPEFYALTMFPYTSGDLHIGHWYAMAPSDVYARYKRMQGYNVLHPIGFDAFGLPAENAAIKHNTHPAHWTYDNIAYMKNQLKKMDFSYDWNRELDDVPLQQVLPYHWKRPQCRQGRTLHPVLRRLSCCLWGKFRDARAK